MSDKRTRSLSERGADRKYLGVPFGRHHRDKLGCDDELAAVFKLTFAWEIVDEHSSALPPRVMARIRVTYWHPDIHVMYTTIRRDLNLSDRAHVDGNVAHAPGGGAACRCRGRKFGEGRPNLSAHVVHTSAYARLLGLGESEDPPATCAAEVQMGRKRRVVPLERW